MRLIILFAVALLRPAPTDAFTDWLTDGAEDLLDATKEGARGLIGTTREMLSEIDGQDVFDSLGKVIGAVKDGVLELSDATGITGEDVSVSVYINPRRNWNYRRKIRIFIREGYSREYIYILRKNICTEPPPPPTHTHTHISRPATMQLAIY